MPAFYVCMDVGVIKESGDFLSQDNAGRVDRHAIECKLNIILGKEILTLLRFYSNYQYMNKS